MKKTSKITISVILLILIVFSITTTAFAASVPTVKYCAHVQSKGWLAWVTTGKIAGTTSNGLRMEALKISLTKNGSSMVTYRAHVSDIGWQAWKNSGGIAGTTGKGKPIEAVQIKLKGDYAKKYDIYYRLHLAYRGWLGWTKNGATAGSTGMRIRSEAIQIKLVKKGAKVSTGAKSCLTKPAFTGRAYVQNKGWLAKVGEGSVIGTTGQGRALRTFWLNFKNFDGQNAIQYRVHLSGTGWQSWKNGSYNACTANKNIEAVQIRLTGTMGNYFNVYYRAHIKNYGWLGWAKNGAIAGSTGGGVQAEAIQVKIIPTQTAFATGGAAYLNLSGSSITAAQLNMLKNKYPEGALWNSSVYMHMGWGCYAFSHECFYLVNGREAVNSGHNFKFENIKAGDCVGKNPYKEDGTQHWVYVISKTATQMTVGEGNYEGRIVHWGRVISKAEFDRDFAYNRVDR